MKLLPLFSLLALAPVVLAQSPEAQQVQAEPAPEAATAVAQDYRLQLYDVRDLVAPKDWDLQADGTGPAAAAIRKQRQADIEAAMSTRLGLYAETIRACVKPTFDREHASVQTMVPGALAVHMTEPQQEWVQRFLELQRGETMVQLQFRIVSLPEKTLAEHGVDRSAIVFEKPDTNGGKDIRKELTKAAREHPSGTLVSTPSVACRTGMRANVSVMNEIAYVKEWELVLIEPGPVEIADPVIDVVQDGFTIDAVAMEVEAGLFSLDVDVHSSRVERPIPTRKIRISTGSDSEVGVSSPVVTTVRLRARLLLADGASAVLCSPTNVDDQSMAILINLDRVRLPDDPAAKEAEPRLKAGTR